MARPCTFQHVINNVENCKLEQMFVQIPGLHFRTYVRTYNVIRTTVLSHRYRTFVCPRVRACVRVLKPQNILISHFLEFQRVHFCEKIAQQNYAGVGVIFCKHKKVSPHREKRLSHKVVYVR